MNHETLRTAKGLPKKTLESMERNHISEKSPISLQDLETSVERAGLTRVFDELVNYSLRYVMDVYNMDKARQSGYDREEEGSREAFEQLDADRTRLHTALHDQIKILIRNLRQKGEDTTWANSMVDMGTGEISRARAGKFGLELVASLVKRADQIFSDEKGL